MDLKKTEERQEQGREQNLPQKESGKMGNGKLEQEESHADTSRKTVLDARVTGVGAGGDFHMSARVRDEKSGEIREMKGMITGRSAAFLRSDALAQNKDAAIAKEAQALASENFEKGMDSLFSRTNHSSIKMG